MTSTSRKGKSCIILVLKAGAALLLAIAAALAVWMIVNRPPSTGPVRRDHLTEREIAIVREALHLLRNMTVRMNLRGDLPFYYSGVMQAMLLDELRPGWKTDFLAGEASFEESLAAAAR